MRERVWTLIHKLRKCRTLTQIKDNLEQDEDSDDKDHGGDVDDEVEVEDMTWWYKQCIHDMKHSFRIKVYTNDDDDDEDDADLWCQKPWLKMLRKQNWTSSNWWHLWCLEINLCHEILGYLRMCSQWSQTSGMRWPPYSNCVDEVWTCITDFHFIVFFDNKNLGIDTKTAFLGPKTIERITFPRLCWLL